MKTGAQGSSEEKLPGSVLLRRTWSGRVQPAERMSGRDSAGPTEIRLVTSALARRSGSSFSEITKPLTDLEVLCEDSECTNTLSSVSSSSRSSVDTLNR